MKEDLLEAIASLDRGAEATPEDQRRVDEASALLFSLDKSFEQLLERIESKINMMGTMLENKIDALTKRIDLIYEKYDVRLYMMLNELGAIRRNNEPNFDERLQEECTPGDRFDEPDAMSFTDEPIQHFVNTDPMGLTEEIKHPISNEEDPDIGSNVHNPIIVTSQPEVGVDVEKQSMHGRPLKKGRQLILPCTEPKVYKRAKTVCTQPLPTFSDVPTDI